MDISERIKNACVVDGLVVWGMHNKIDLLDACMTKVADLWCRVIFNHSSLYCQLFLVSIETNFPKNEISW